MNLLFTFFAFFTIYPDVTKIKVVNGNELTPSSFNFHHYVTLNEDKPNLGIFRRWNEKEEGLSIRGVRPIVLHALNEWKRASLIQGRIDIPNSQFYWGPHGLVKRSIEDENGGDENMDFIQNTPRYSQANGYKEEYGEHSFDVIPTIILNMDDYSSPYETYGTKKYFVPCSYKSHESYGTFGNVKENLQHWKSEPQYVQSKSESYRSSEPRDPTLHSHGHSHFHQHVHSHGLNVLGPQTQLHGGAGFVHNSGLVTNVPISSTVPQTQLHGGTGFVHNSGLVTNVPISSTVPQTHITNINIPQQHTTGFTSNLNGGFNSGLSHGLGGFSSHQAAVNIGHGGLGGFGTTNGNVQIAQVSGANNAVAQTSFREAEEEGRSDESVLGSPYIFQFPLNSRRVNFDRSSSKEGHNQRLFQRKKRSIFPTELVSKILRTVADDNVKINDRPKRSLPLVKLAVDPNAKLDVFQTSDNIGKLIKSSIEDEKSPVSHLKDITGSLRDTFISSTRIIPSDVIIPARYKIIDKHQHDIVKIPLARSSENKDCDDNIVSGINPAVYQQPAVSQSKPGTAAGGNHKVSAPKKSKTLFSNDSEKLSNSDSTSFSKTYQKIGDMIRNTVVSSQQTLSHINDAISSGRKLAHISKGAAPRLLLPLTKVPALEEPGSKPKTLPESDRVLLVAPKGTGVDEMVGSPYNRQNGEFVSTSNLFNSIGLTYPTEEDNEYLLQRSPSKLRKKHLLLANNKGSHVDGALEVLNEAEETVDATNLHDFIIKLKNELERPHMVGEENVIGTDPSSKSCACSKGRGKATEVSDNRIYQNADEAAKDPIVESAFLTNKDLLKPFMGRITLEDLHKMLNPKDKDNERKPISSKRQINQQFNSRIKRKSEHNGEHIVGAINPNLFEEYFNEPLQDIKDHHRDPFKEPADQKSRQNSNDIELEMKNKKFLLKPFGTNKSPEETKKILDKFGYYFVANDGRRKTLPKIYEIASISS